MKDAISMVSEHQEIIWGVLAILTLLVLLIYLKISKGSGRIIKNLDGEPVYDKKTGQFLLPFSMEQQTVLRDCINLGVSIDGVAYPTLPADLMRDAGHSGHDRAGVLDAWKLTHTKLTPGQYVIVRDSFSHGVNLIDDLDDVTAYSAEQLFLIYVCIYCEKNDYKKVRKNWTRAQWEAFDEKVFKIFMSYQKKYQFYGIMSILNEFAISGGSLIGSINKVQSEARMDTAELYIKFHSRLMDLYKLDNISPDKTFVKNRYLQMKSLFPYISNLAQTMQKTEKPGGAFQQQASSVQNDVDKSLITVRGEKVKSKSEVIIANILDKYGIEYEYEKEVTLDGRTIKPDFTFTDPESGHTWYWEHCGMMNNQEYAANWKLKKERYARCGIREDNDIRTGDKLIVTYDNNGGLDSSLIDTMVEAIVSHAM